MTGTTGASNPQVRNRISAIAAGSEIGPETYVRVGGCSTASLIG